VRHLAVWALTLTGCASVHGPLDVITPDELTIGHGKTTGLMNGGYTGHNDMFEYEGESDSTYAALTWHIPSFQDPALTRAERRELRESNLATEDVVEDNFEVGALKLNIREGVEPPPMWAIGAIVGALALFFLLIFIKSRRSQPWS
tara:strand:- start:531 stop:968 length:438 start_codon:yes stop_codon:yes gene_type:complete